MNKYRAKAVWHCMKCDLEAPQAGCIVCHGKPEKFDSGKEYKRWHTLRQSPQVQNLRRQVRYPLACDGRPILIRSKGYPNGRQAVMVADFVYEENGETVVEDSKGMDTPVSRLKRAIFEAQYGIQVRVT